MSDPAAIREANLNALGRQLTLLQWAVGCCLIVIIAVAVGGFVLLQKIVALDSKAVALQQSTNDVKVRIERMNALVGGTLTGITTLLKEQDTTGKALARIEATTSAQSAPPPNPPAPPPSKP